MPDVSIKATMMKTKRIFCQTLSVAVLLCFIKSVAISNTIPLTSEIIQSWWTKKSTEKMTIDGDLVPITLKNKEKAFLVPIYISRGRNDSWHTALVRPVLMEIREIGHPVRRDSKVFDLDHDDVSEIETVSLGSGQGTTRGEKSLVQFDNWEPTLIHKAEFYDNLGCCGPPEWGCGSCEARVVEWRYEDIDGDGTDDLIEEITIKNGPLSDRLKSNNIVNRFLFKFGILIEI